jgi:poly-gamma-glutamate synthesis protein (capsule biosynthesis protein)
MLGRGVAGSVASDPDEVFAGVRHLLTGADIAGANLESPLSSRPHVSPNENVILAPPESAAVLAGAGFDLVSLPNNHAADAGLPGILDTIAAVDAVGLRTVGAGADAEAAATPLEISISDLAVGFLAFDATGVAPAAGDGPGVMVWDGATGPAMVAALRATSDIVVVSIHGGSEYLPTNDPVIGDIAEQMVAAGADIVWGHGAHVMQPVYAIELDRRAVVATSLGNFIFDQSGPGRTTGAMLEVLAGAAGVVAYRVAVTEHGDRRVHFVEWEQPEGDAAWFDGSWWSLVGPQRLDDPGHTTVAAFRHGDLSAAAEGNVTGNGTRHVVASFRRPFVETDYARLRPDTQWADRAGRSAHVGVYTMGDLTELWVAGSVAMPVAELAVCPGAIAVAHDSLDDATVTATGAWVWNGFGFATAPDLPGAGTPGCADVDGDGGTEPVILNRTTTSP